MINLFKPWSSTIVARRVLEKRWRADLQRRNEMELRLDLYQDNFMGPVEEALKAVYCPELYERIRFYINGSQNVLKRVVNELSMVYKAEAKRVLDKPSPRYDELKESLDYPTKMKAVNRYTTLMNETAIKISVRRGQIMYDLITPNVLGVIVDEHDPTWPISVWFQTIIYDKDNLPRVAYHYYYEDGSVELLDYNWNSTGMVYTADDTPYKYEDGSPFLPFVFFHKTEPIDVFLDMDSGRDLMNAAVALHMKNTLLDYYFKNASHKQIYVIGDDVKIPANQIADPSAMLIAQHGPHGSAQIGTLDLQNRMVELITAQTYQINGVINNYGISADMWSMKISEVSGRALKIRNRALLEMREDQLPLYRRYEKELFEKTRAINNNLAGGTDEKGNRLNWELIPWDAEFSMDFGEIDFPEDPAVEIDIETRKLQAGIISLGQFYQHFNPDTTDEGEAEKAIINNLTKTGKLRQKSPDLDKALNEIFQEGGTGMASGAPGQPGAGGAKPDQGGSVGKPTSAAQMGDVSRSLS